MKNLILGAISYVVLDTVMFTPSIYSSNIFIAAGLSIGGLFSLTLCFFDEDNPFFKLAIKLAKEERRREK
jgi:hypothetical protein